jgi:hypothetical protein
VHETSPAFKRGGGFVRASKATSRRFWRRDMRRCPRAAATAEVFVGAAVLANKLLRIAPPRPQGVVGRHRAA